MEGDGREGDGRVEERREEEGKEGKEEGREDKGEPPIEKSWLRPLNIRQNDVRALYVRYRKNITYVPYVQWLLKCRGLPTCKQSKTLSSCNSSQSTV